MRLYHYLNLPTNYRLLFWKYSSTFMLSWCCQHVHQQGVSLLFTNAMHPQSKQEKDLCRCHPPGSLPTRPCPGLGHPHVSPGVRCPTSPKNISYDRQRLFLTDCEFRMQWPCRLPAVSYIIHKMELSTSVRSCLVFALPQSSEDLFLTALLITCNNKLSLTPSTSSLFSIP